MTVTTHKLHLADRAVMLATRAVLATAEKPALVPESRSGFDAMIAKAPSAEGVEYEAATIGGVAGWWCRPPNARPGATILYLHGGAYVLGSAYPYRNFAGQIAARAGAAAFVADYALAPERPFPAAFDDAFAIYKGLGDVDYDAVCIAGDSAGGGLALALLSIAVDQSRTGRAPPPAGAALISPWIDLTLSGETMITRADADPLLTRVALAEAAGLYLDGADPYDPRASALLGHFDGLPPVTIHVGDDEILLDDALRYAREVEANGGSVDVHVWQGMVHVFPSNSMLRAASQALDGIGASIRASFDRFSTRDQKHRRELAT